MSIGSGIPPREALPSRVERQLDNQGSSGPTGDVQEWISLKSFILWWTGVDSGAAHVLASVFALVAVAAVIRRPLWSWLSWFAVLILEIINEAATGLADGVLEEWELVGSLRDVPLVMAMPTLLLLICRLAPQMVAPESPATELSPAVDQPRDTIIDADYEELS